MYLSPEIMLFLFLAFVVVVSSLSNAEARAKKAEEALTEQENDLDDDAWDPDEELAADCDMYEYFNG